MFIIAVPQFHSNIGLLKRFKAWRARRDTVQLYKYGGITFYTIAIPIKKGVPNYSELQELGPRFSGRLLMAQGLGPTEDLNSLLFLPKQLPQKIMLNVSTKICDSLPIPLIRRSIGLVDADGIYTSFAEKLIKHSPTVKIFTNNFEAYENTQEELLSLYGAPLVITNRISSLADCQVIYSPNPSDADEAAKLGAITVSGGVQGNFEWENVFSLYELDIPLEAAEHMPQGVNPIHFLSAAYELCGKREYEDILPHSLLTGRQVLAYSSLSDYIKKRYKVPGVSG
ncbi:hypothetical protein [Acetanaerobacterium elongatum]|uniref:Uncharacterized protein n=1 Tax=Acetanaerobacterium elongatum TaxID=258515 RepID=A0A1H0FPM3_9FIRM|nr:hypothetical protein [Acetanaerobacterium elongatum]SDN96482.1 hypothetical protein SAMN05192585_1427 [Acetanaerobacterium elongatum]